MPKPFVTVSNIAAALSRWRANGKTPDEIAKDVWSMMRQAEVNEAADAA
jgi:hypothetical protein